MISIEDIQRKYKRAILESQKLYAGRRAKDTAGAVRYTKGKIVEDITKDIIRVAWSKISSDETRLKMDKKKIVIKTNDEVYRLSQDIHVYIDDIFRISVECKSYTEVAMYKRVLVDASLLKEAVPTINAFFIVQLENFLGGDYGAKIEAKESESVITLDRLYPQINMHIITMLDGDRDIKKPLHMPEYFKPLREERLHYAIEQFRKAMLTERGKGGFVREPLGEYETTPRPYPNAKLLRRERKVVDRIEKEKMRKGTKDLTTIKSKITEVDVSGIVDKIICGDSEEILGKFPDNFVDIIITSPPYNFGLDYKDDKNKDAIYWQDYFEKLNRIWKECYRVLKPAGRFCVNIQPLFSDYMPTHHIISKQLLDLGLLWKAEILWEKHNYNCKYTAWGSWKSPSMPYLKYTWEFIEIFCKESHKKEGDSTKIDITGDEFKKWVYAKWDIAPERNMKKYNHPAMFPEELVARLLKLFSYQDDVVLDPFNGVGTTTLVAYKLRRYYIGIDISEEYCKTAEERLKDEQKQRRLF
jgi:site-specific DNA-methyltransferase (adenine-specific)